jgi:hypothetical protein
MAIPWGVSKPGPATPIAEVRRFLVFPPEFLPEFPFGTPATPITCLGCGQEGPLRDGSYCSSACRKREWRRRRRIPLICAGCCQQFTPAIKGQLHCNRACRFKAYRRRLEAKAEAERVREAARVAAAERAAGAARRRQEAEAAAHRKAVDLAHSLIG